jgi:hypothetical protein
MGCASRGPYFTRQPPCAATLHTVMRRIDREGLEAQLGAWAEELLAETPALVCQNI